MEKRDHQIPLKLALLITVVVACGAEWCGGKPGSGDGGPCVDGPRSSSDQPNWLAALRTDRDALQVSRHHWYMRTDDKIVICFCFI